jgi:hypothetical protein
MIHHLRSRLRIVVATTICALVAAPALVAGTTSIAAAAPPGSLTGLLTVGGEANDVTDTNPWRFYGDAYSALRTDLVDPANFGSAGTFNKGRFQIAPTGMNDVTPAALANLDVFFGGIPRGGWDASESTALQNFVLNGGGLVLNLNQTNFGDLPAWLSSLGLALSPDRAFFGPSPCWSPVTPIPDTAPVLSTSIGSHPVISGPFGPSGSLTMYHTAAVLTATGSATPRYSVTMSGTATQFGIDGPVGDVSVPFTIDTASVNIANITSVAFSIDGAPFATVNSRPFTANVSSLAVGAHTLSAVATLVGGGTITGTSDINVVSTPPTAVAYRGCPGSGNETINNNISGTTVATFQPGALGAGSGPVIVTSDLDFFSNFFTGSAIGPNRTFALNAFAWMMDSIAPAKVPDTYFPLVNPIRVYDSRLSGGPVPSGSSRAIKVAGITVGGITVPAEATSIIANVTAVDPEEAGFLTVYPSGATPPTNTSTHNFGKGENFANTVVMAVGSGGNISILNQFYSGPNASLGTQVLVDVIGYSAANGTGAHLRTISPIRALDSRVGTGGLKEPFHARVARDLSIVGQPGIPSNVQAVVLNMTVAEATNTGSFVTVWPSGEVQPGISNLNIIAGITRPNLVVARVGSNGKISIVNDSGDTQILADIVGYFEPGGTGGSITGKTPSRELDTRAGTAFGPGETRSMAIQGLPGIPAGAKTIILKVTAADPTANGGYLTVWPSGSGTTPPNVSSLNFNAGMNIPNLVITQIGNDGKINIYNAFGSTQVLVDVLGYAD